MKKINLKIKVKKAFSLIELIFIISVLGIIAAVAVPKLLDSRSSAVVTTIKQDIVTITTSIQSYYMLNSGIEKITDSVNINPNMKLIIYQCIFLEKLFLKLFVFFCLSQS